MASPASYSSPSAAYPIPASCSQTLQLHPELLANTSSLDIHPGISVINICIYRYVRIILVVIIIH